MLTFKRFHECTLDEAVQAYNRGFEGYYFDQSKTADTLALKMGKEELSPLYSVLAFMNDEPVGIVLNGIWQRRGKKVAWNGGTGVAPAYRNQGIGRALMEETLRIYEEQEVELATLVAIRENEKAISLYEKMGFQLVDQSIFLEKRGELRSLDDDRHSRYRIVHGIPHDVYQLPFWTNPVWDIQWQTIENKEALLVMDNEEQVIGYALYRRIFADDQSLATILLFHCEADPKCQDQAETIRYALAHVFAPLDVDCHRLTVNLPGSNLPVVTALQDAGFARMAEQVFMTKVLKR
ncbi:GNAT family N-acetyltransferase [Brevibacillus reuszeri]|uniref:GNAT family N-acetyltransferase n=1 Tax=Brevibacillus reuszeri TaxID=54915 RepID=UPI00289C4EF6|nr:GNAT family N-acetyltransferase [Brevibacillus reuszeri]